MVDTTLLPYWEVARGIRRGPNRRHWIETLNTRCLEEPDPKLQKLYLKLEEELHNEQHEENAA